MAISSDVKLEIYNLALYHLGSRKLSSLSENREPRRVLDELWGSSDRAVKYALGRAGWNFAMRVQQLTLDESLETQFGWSYAYVKPSDMIRLEALGADEYFRVTFTDAEYADEAGYWLTDHQTIYVKYVSSNTDYGFDSSLWTEAFKEFLAAYLAFYACERLTGSTTKKDMIGGEMVRALKHAKSRDSMDEGVKVPQMSSWTRARLGRGGERGSRNKLIG